MHCFAQRNLAVDLANSFSLLNHEPKPIFRYTSV